MKWKTQKGDLIELSDMTNSHLLNAYKMIKRNKPSVYKIIINRLNPQSIDDCYSYEKENDNYKNEIKAFNYLCGEFEKELQKRNIDFSKIQEVIVPRVYQLVFN